LLRCSAAFVAAREPFRPLEFCFGFFRLATGAIAFANAGLSKATRVTHRNAEARRFCRVEPATFAISPGTSLNRIRFRSLYFSLNWVSSDYKIEDHHSIEDAVRLLHQEKACAVVIL
jgi:hypothetical protein